MHNGRLLKSFFHVVKEYIEENTFNYNLKETMPHLIKSFGRLQQTTAFIASKGLSAVSYTHLTLPTNREV